MKYIKSLLFTALFTFPVLSTAQSINFSQAWQQVIKVSNKLQASHSEVNRAKAEQDGASDMYLPSLNLVGSYTHLSDPFETGDQNVKLPITGIGVTIPSVELSEQDVFRSSLQAMWPIYTGGKISAAQGIREAQVKEKEAQHEIEKNKLFVQLVDRYYGLAVTQSLAKTQQQLVVSLEKHAEHAKKLEEQGQIAKVERLNAQVALANAKISASSAQRQAEMAKIALAKMIHEKTVETYSSFFVLKHPLSFAELSEETMSNHPALRLLKTKEDQAQGLIDIEKGNYHPTVFLYGNYTLYEDDSLFSQSEPDWLVGVGVKIPLLSRDGRSGKVQAAKSAQLQARYTRAQTQQDLDLLLEKNYRDLQQAEEEIESLNLSLELATENERLRDLAFHQGLSTSIEKVDAELKLTAVKTRQLAAKYHYIQAYARLMSMSSQISQFIRNSKERNVKNEAE